MGIDQLQLIDTGLDPVTAEREQWDDGNNTLAIEPKVAVAYERNVETNQRLVEAGIEVIPIAGSELGSGRGGPRCMSCPIARDLSNCTLTGGPPDPPPSSLANNDETSHAAQPRAPVVGEVGRLS